MLTDYIRAAMRHAVYDRLDDGTYYGEIVGIEGVYANETTLDACRQELQSVLEDWLVFSLANGFPIPPIDGLELRAAKIA
ncbi:MAG: type II toxin-antitoxin system HicB family antitoxin [Chloroflexi bacterium]|nr:type II toxin-antitoxin system HicB family antitoxin [Chloroflexota bacterium]